MLFMKIYDCKHSPHLLYSDDKDGHVSVNGLRQTVCLTFHFLTMTVYFFYGTHHSFLSLPPPTYLPLVRWENLPVPSLFLHRLVAFEYRHTWTDAISVSYYTWVSLFSLFTLPAISAISSRDTHIPICSWGPTGTRFARQSGRPRDAADQTRRSFQLGLKQLSKNTVAQADYSHQHPHLQICKCKTTEFKEHYYLKWWVIITSLRKGKVLPDYNWEPVISFNSAIKNSHWCCHRPRQLKTILVNQICDQAQHEARCDSFNKKQLPFDCLTRWCSHPPQNCMWETSNETFVSVPSLHFCQNIPMFWHNIQQNFCQGEPDHKAMAMGQTHYIIH